MTEFTLRLALFVAVGGAAGAVARYGLTAWLPRDAFPWGTTVVNLVGSFALGVLLFSAFAGAGAATPANAFVAVGFLGAFTTMSAFAVETLALLEAGSVAKAVAFVAVNPVACVAGAAVGRAVVAAVA